MVPSLAKKHTELLILELQYSCLEAGSTGSYCWVIEDVVEEKIKLGGASDSWHCHSIFHRIIIITCVHVSSHLTAEFALCHSKTDNRKTGSWVNQVLLQFGVGNIVLSNLFE